MYPQLRTVLVARFFLSASVRVLLTALLAYEILDWMDYIVRQALAGHWEAALHGLRSPTAWSSLLVLLLIGGIFLVLERRLSRFLIPMPRRACPQCGYRLAFPMPVRCSECGLILQDAPDDHVASAPPHSSGESPP